MPRENLLSLFRQFDRYASDVAIVERRGYRRESWTYAKLSAAAVAFAIALKSRGIRTGDCVLLCGPNSTEWLAAFWGCLLRGAVAVPMDDAAASDFVVRVAQDAAVKLLVASRENVARFAPRFGAQLPILTLEDLSDRLTGSSDAARSHVPRGTPSIEISSLADEPITRTHVAQILFTSGTTAEPRGVVLTHGNFLANLEPLERGFAPYRRWERWFHPLRFVTLVPTSHVFGQFMALFVPLLLGATVVFEPSTNPHQIMRTIKRERATALIAVPRMLDCLRAAILGDTQALAQKNRFAASFAAAKKQKFLRRAWIFRRVHRVFGWNFWAMISGGAALDRDTEDFFKRMGYAVVQGYGMTETASLISLNHPFRTAEGSLGKILPGREFRLADDGEILVRGENVAAGYWEHGALRSGVQDQDHWLRTGDLGEFDAAGNLCFRGRKKNVIVTPAGLNIYPEDLETALRRQPAVRDCVVIPVARSQNAEPLAILLANDSDDAIVAAAIDAANSALAEYQRIHTWLIWPDPDFPRTPTGKPRLSLIADRATQLLCEQPIEEPAPVAAGDRGARFSSPSLESIFTALANTSTSAKPSPNLERGLNLTSLDRAELLSALEQRYQVELNESSFAQAKTVRDLQQLLHQPSAPRAKYSYPRWAQRAPIRFLGLAAYYALVWPATQILAHPKIIGRQHLRDLHGPALFISNHITRRADIGLILAALPLRFQNQLAIAMGGESLENMRRPPRDWFFAKRGAYQLGYWLLTALFNVFPLPQFSGFRESFRFAGESVDRGYSLLIFPEGEVNNSEDGRMGCFQSGIGLLAENLRIPIIPMRLDGVWQMKREHRRFARFGEITVRVGAPVTFPADTPPDKIARALESLVHQL
jgi:long-chain acyl-CoA synthetase